MKYELDLSDANEIDLAPWVRKFKIPCKTGEHQLAFDVIECDVPKDIYLEMVAKAKGKGDVEAFPIGFNNIPIGGILKRIN